MDKPYTLQYDDIDEELVDRIEPEAIRGAVIFYASKRHILEILPEALTSLWLELSLIIVLLNASPWQMCDVSLCRFVVSFIVALLGGVFFLIPFGLELWRWNRDIYYSTSQNWSRWFFSFRDMDYHNENMGFVTSTRVTTPWIYRRIGWDVGTLTSLSVDESKRLTPLMPKPYILQRRIREAQSYKPPKPSSKTGVPLWRE